MYMYGLSHKLTLIHLIGLFTCNVAESQQSNCVNLMMMKYGSVNHVKIMENMSLDLSTQGTSVDNFLEVGDDPMHAVCSIFQLHDTL